MTIFDSIKSLMCICEWFGLTSFTLNRKTKRWQSKTFSKYLSIAIIFFNVAIFSGTLAFNDTLINYQNSKFRVFLTALVLSWNHVVAICVLCELFLKRQQQIKLFNMLEMLDILYRHRLNMHVNYAKLKKISRRILILWICGVLIFLISDGFYCIQTGNKRIIYFILSFTPSYAICKLSYGYSIIQVSLINEFLDVLNVYLKSVTKQHGYYICETFIHEPKPRETNGCKARKFDLQLEMILHMKNAYSKLWEGSVAIKNQMHYSLVIALSNEFFILIYSAYGMFSNIFLRPEPLSFFLLLSTWISIGLANMIFITHNYQKVVRTVSQRNR